MMIENGGSGGATLHLIAGDVSFTYNTNNNAAVTLQSPGTLKISGGTMTIVPNGISTFNNLHIDNGATIDITGNGKLSVFNAHFFKGTKTRIVSSTTRLYNTYVKSANNGR